MDHAPGVCDVDFPESIGDAFCDYTATGLNIAACGWDGGDCCVYTCKDPINPDDKHFCGEGE